MANDLVVNLDAFKTERVPDAELPVDESLAGGIGTAYAIIGYKGKTWSLRYRGETHLFKRKDGTLVDHIDVVILHAAPKQIQIVLSRIGKTVPAIHRCALHWMALCPTSVWNSNRPKPAAFVRAMSGRRCQMVAKAANALITSVWLWR